MDAEKITSALDAALEAHRDSGNPKTVVDSFAPGTPYTLDMRTILLLEAIKPAVAVGTISGLGDVLLLHLAMTEYEKLEAALAENGAHQYLWERAKDFGPAQVAALAGPIREALEKEFAPVAPAGGGGEKKSTTPSAGGSPSTTS